MLMMSTSGAILQAVAPPLNGLRNASMQLLIEIAGVIAITALLVYDLTAGALL
jgi:hypothetical protein